MRIVYENFCPNCEKTTEGSFSFKVYYCNECGKSCESYEKLVKEEKVEDKPIKVIVHLKKQSQPIVHEGVINTYEKGFFYCVYVSSEVVYKYPLASIWRITESYGSHGREVKE